MKIDATTLLLIGAAGVGIYLITRPRIPAGVNPATGLPYATSPAYNPYAVNPYNPYATNPGNSAASIISSGGSALSSIAEAISNIWG